MRVEVKIWNNKGLKDLQVEEVNLGEVSLQSNLAGEHALINLNDWPTNIKDSEGIEIPVIEAPREIPPEVRNN